MINGFVNAIELVRAKSGDNCLRISTENCNTRFKNEFRYTHSNYFVIIQTLATLV